MLENIRLYAKVKGNSANIVIRSLERKSERLNHALARSGDRWAKIMSHEAKLIINDKAPTGSGALSKSIKFTTEKTNKGYNSTVWSPLPYAKLVDSGGPKERKRMDADLSAWVLRTYPPMRAKQVIKQKTLTVRAGNNPRYNTFEGMGFFRDTFNKYVHYDGSPKSKMLEDYWFMTREIFGMK
jgi:hypothetical protein